MSLVRVPVELIAALAAPLALRGVRATTGEEAVAAAAARTPVPGARWLALVADEAAAQAALDGGADDVALPHEGPALLAARLARLARGGRLRVGPLELDPLDRRVWRDGRPLALLPREYAVLLHLMRNAGALVTRAELRAAVWGGGGDPGTNVIEVHVSRLRAALDRAAPAMLRTERGRGYRLVAPPAIALPASTPPAIAPVARAS